MKNYLTLVAVLLSLSSNLNAQNAITLSQHNATLNLGDSIEFAVTLAVQPGYDASVFLNTSCSPEGIAIVSPSIINYPYSKPIVASFKTLKYYKKGTYKVTVTASIGGTIVSDSCNIIVNNTSPWRIFNAMYNETRPSCVVVDKRGTIYFSHLYTGGGSGDNPGRSASTTLSNPKFEGAPSFGPKTWQILLDDESEKNYFLTGEGVSIYKGSNITIYNTSTSAIPSNTVKRGVLDADGRLWLGTPSGLASLENYTITAYDNANTNSVLGKETITALTVDARNRVWIGTPTGLVMKDGNTWTRYTPDNSGLPAPYIFGIVEDNNGAMWMGAGNFGKHGDSGFNDCPESMVGLVRFDGVLWTQFNSTNSPLASNYVNSLTIDKKGNLWVGTASYFLGSKAGVLAGCGLLKYDGTNWTTFNTSNSLLPDNDVQWVGTDRTGNIWFSCKQMFGVMNEEGIPFLVNDVEEQQTQTSQFTITPNPSSTTITISGTDAISAVTIVNSFGMEVVGRQTISSANGTLNVDVSDLASGVYFVQLRTPAGMISKPIVVMH